MLPVLYGHTVYNLHSVNSTFPVLVVYHPQLEEKDTEQPRKEEDVAHKPELVVPVGVIL